MDVKTTAKFYSEGLFNFKPCFTLKSLIDISFSKKKKKYCAFIDFKKTFDIVWRSGLCMQLILFGITGKFFNIVRDIFHNVKSCVQLNNTKSA